MGWMVRLYSKGAGRARWTRTSRQAARWFWGLLLCCGMAAGMGVAQAPSTSPTDRIAALEKSVAREYRYHRQGAECGRQRLDADQRGAGVDDERPRAGAVLWRSGAQEEHPRNDDADLRHDGGDYRALGLVTYSLAFGAGNAFIGGLHNVFLRGVGLTPDPAYAPTIPLQTYMVYQLMFAIITPALITGAFAERMKFSAMLVFMVLWAIVVYSPMAHMVWGVGGLLNAAAVGTGGLAGRFPCLDFAGGTVVHVTSGVSALVTAIYLGKRLGFPQKAFMPHSVVLSFIGACLLWVGWFGFNAGSALGASGLATSAFIATQFGAAAAAIGWSAVEWFRSGKPSASGQDLRRGSGSGRDYAGVWICIADERAMDRSACGQILLPDGRQRSRMSLVMTTRWTPLACMARAGPWAPS